MTVMIGLLRGVNVGGGSTKLLMADLKAVAASCGLTDATTYVQSGNIVFHTTLKKTSNVEATLESALARDSSVAPAVMVRSAAELDAVIAANPFAGRTDDPTQLHVGFGKEAATLPALDFTTFLPEAVAVEGRESYLYLPNGMGRSKLATELAKPKYKAITTMRNWRTVLALRDLATSLAVGQPT